MIFSPNRYKWITAKVPIEPLAVFRIVFSAVMLFSTIRFALNGWIYELYVAPKFYFTYYGFNWVKPLGEYAMYAIFIALAISFLFQMLGLFYRTASIFSFLAFTYIELIDKTNYLNHYYFVSLICFLLVLVPANRNYSIDVYLRGLKPKSKVPAWTVNIFKFQLIIVYFFAGLAKLNYDWMIEALPLKIWLPSKSNIALIGPLFSQEWLAYIFSWFGAIYDLTIWVFLLNNRTRLVAYLFVIIFHFLTWVLFPIGVFPYVMIGATIIFFSNKFHTRLLRRIRFDSFYKKSEESYEFNFNKPLLYFMVFYISLQLILPLRYLAFPKDLFWHEEGYRFSWRVMLMEKAGYTIFKVKDKSNQRSWEVNNYDFLTPNQEKMMSTQSDMILQFAHYLNNYYCKEFKACELEIKVDSYVTLNGEMSRKFIDPSIDLSKVEKAYSNREIVLERN